MDGRDLLVFISIIIISIIFINVIQIYYIRYRKTISVPDYYKLVLGPRNLANKILYILKYIFDDFLKKEEIISQASILGTDWTVYYMENGDIIYINNLTGEKSNKLPPGIDIDNKENKSSEIPGTDWVILFDSLDKLYYYNNITGEINYSFPENLLDSQNSGSSTPSSSETTTPSPSETTTPSSSETTTPSSSETTTPPSSETTTPSSSETTTPETTTETTITQGMIENALDSENPTESLQDIINQITNSNDIPEEYIVAALNSDEPISTIIQLLNDNGVELSEDTDENSIDINEPVFDPNCPRGYTIEGSTEVLCDQKIENYWCSDYICNREGYGNHLTQPFITDMEDIPRGQYPELLCCGRYNFCIGNNGGQENLPNIYCPEGYTEKSYDQVGRTIDECCNKELYKWCSNYNGLDEHFVCDNYHTIKPDETDPPNLWDTNIIDARNNYNEYERYNRDHQECCLLINECGDFGIEGGDEECHNNAQCVGCDIADSSTRLQEVCNINYNEETEYGSTRKICICDQGYVGDGGKTEEGNIGCNRIGSEWCSTLTNPCDSSLGYVNKNEFNSIYIGTNSSSSNIINTCCDKIEDEWCTESGINCSPGWRSNSSNRHFLKDNNASIQDQFDQSCCIQNKCQIPIDTYDIEAGQPQDCFNGTVPSGVNCAVSCISSKYTSTPSLSGDGYVGTLECPVNAVHMENINVDNIQCEYKDTCSDYIQNTPCSEGWTVKNNNNYICGNGNNGECSQGEYDCCQNINECTLNTTNTCNTNAGCQDIVVSMNTPNNQTLDCNSEGECYECTCGNRYIGSGDGANGCVKAANKWCSTWTGQCQAGYIDENNLDNIHNNGGNVNHSLCCQETYCNLDGSINAYMLNGTPTNDCPSTLIIKQDETCNIKCKNGYYNSSPGASNNEGTLYCDPNDAETGGNSQRSGIQCTSTPSVCGNGQYINSQPTQISGIQCSPMSQPLVCPSGSWRNFVRTDGHSTSNHLSCQPHTSCDSNQIVSTQGTSTSDTECIEDPLIKSSSLNKGSGWIQNTIKVKMPGWVFGALARPSGQGGLGWGHGPHNIPMFTITTTGSFTWAVAGNGWLKPSESGSWAQRNGSRTDAGTALKDPKTGSWGDTCARGPTCTSSANSVQFAGEDRVSETSVHTDIAVIWILNNGSGTVNIRAVAQDTIQSPALDGSNQKPESLTTTLNKTFTISNGTLI